MAQEANAGMLHTLSSELAGVVERASPSIVRVEDGSRLTATGTIWSADGMIVTTSHGVERDEELSVELADGTRLPAELLGRDEDTDVALLRINATGLAAIPRAQAGDVKVGHLALALGRPGHRGLQATLGIISARYESQTSGQDEYILNTDAVLYPGFSGGPLVTADGRMVGMCNLVYGRGQGVALGVPTIANVAEALQSQGRVRRGYLGVRTQPVMLPEHLRQSIPLEQDRGLLVVQVEPKSPAEQGGLLLGDTLLGLGGHTIRDVDELRRHLRARHAGDAIQLNILRGGNITEIKVILGAEE